MNLLLLTEADRVEGDIFRVTGARLRHLQDTLRAAPGDSLRVGLLNGVMGEGRLEEIDTSQALLMVEVLTPPPEKIPLCLVLALPRPKMLRRILRTVAEFGVPELHLVNSYRVEKSYWQTPVLSPATTRDYFMQGLTQSRDTQLPQLHCHRRFKPFVEDELPGMIAGRRALLAHPGDYPPCPRGGEGATLLVIGPEGGFIPYEAEQLEAAGCETVSLGPRILRVENAITSLLGRLF